MMFKQVLFNDFESMLLQKLNKISINLVIKMSLISSKRQELEKQLNLFPHHLDDLSENINVT